MKLALSVVQSQGTGSWADVEEIGTLKSQLSKGDVIRLSNKNLAGTARVTLFITEKGSEAPKMLSCSTYLSNSVRGALKKGIEQKKLLAALINLNIIKNDEGYFLIPSGQQGEGFTLDDLKTETSTFEELVAY